MNDERLKSLLSGVELPDEAEARERSWQVIRAAYEGRQALPRARRSNRRPALALAASVAVLAIALTPAGAKVGDVFRDVTGIGASKPAPSLTALPAPGRLLVDSPVGPWVVQDDGSKRLLGDYAQATWSPAGLYIGVAKGRELAAVDPEGNLRWTIDQPARVRDPRWSPSGFRVGYLSGSELHVVAGDGSGDHLVADHVSRVPPAWKPLDHDNASLASQGESVPEVAAYVGRDGRIVVINVDTEETLWRSAAPQAGLDALQWSSDGQMLLASGPRNLATYVPSESTAPVAGGYGTAGGATIRAATFVPGTHRVAETVQLPGAGGPGMSEVRYGRADTKLFLSDPLISRHGQFDELIPSPDGRWLLVTEPDADHWVFVRLSDGRAKVEANIARQFDPGASGPLGFPSLEGWCCGP